MVQSFGTPLNKAIRGAIHGQILNTSVRILFPRQLLSGWSR